MPLPEPRPLLGVGVQRNTPRSGGKCRRPAGAGWGLFCAEQLSEAEAPAEVVPATLFAAPVWISHCVVILSDHVIVIGIWEGLVSDFDKYSRTPYYVSLL